MPSWAEYVILRQIVLQGFGQSEEEKNQHNRGGTAQVQIGEGRGECSLIVKPVIGPEFFETRRFR